MRSLKSALVSVARPGWNFYKKLNKRALLANLKHDKHLQAVIGSANQRVFSAPATAPVRSYPAGGATAISVIVPFFRDELYVELAIRSLQAQTLRDFECILINDVSPDGTAGIVAKITKDDRRFRVVRHNVNCGLSAARNTGLREAQGEYIQFLDADDMLATDALATKLAAARKYETHEEVAGSYCANLNVNDAYSKIGPSAASSSHKIQDFYTSKGTCPFAVHQPLIRREVALKAGGFDESMTTAEDHDFWYRILRNGYCFVPTGLTSSFYRLKGGASMATASAEQHLVNSCALIAAARAPMLDEHKFSDAPFQYVQPWDHYDRAVHIAGRVLSYGAMGGSNGISEAINRFLPADTHWVVDRHVNVLGNIAAGKSRAVGDTAPHVPRGANGYFSPQLGEFIKPTAAGFGGIVPQHSSRGRHRQVDVVFLPHKDYHVESINALRPKLESAGITFEIVDFARRYRDEGAKRKAIEFGLSVSPNSALDLGWLSARMAVSFNDWDPIVREYFAKLKAGGARTLAIVEGVQDYDDVDTGRPRGAYKTADVIIVPGEHDMKYFREAPVQAAVGGVANVERIWLSNFTEPPARRAVVNCNFSYNVLIEARDGWMSGIAEATKAAGVDFIVSQHPGDKGDLSAYPVTDRSIYAEMAESNILVTRFSTCVLEALAMGRRVIYHNPHGEKVDKFMEPDAPFKVTRSVGDLVSALTEYADLTTNHREASANYLAWHCNVDPHRSRTIAVDAVAEQLIDAIEGGAVLRRAAV